MRKRLLILVAIAGVFVAGFLLGNRLMPVQGQAKPGAGFAAIPGSVGGQDVFGAYDVVKDWPQNISTLPGNEKWTCGAGQGILRRKSQPRIYAVPRRIAQYQAAGDEAAAGLRAKPSISDRPAAVA